MRKYAILLTLIVLSVSCSVKEKPEFLAINNIKFIDATEKTVTISADANFKNPNSISGKLSTEKIDVFVNDVIIATLTSEEFEVPAKDLFTIPLIVNVPTDSIFNTKSFEGLIGSLFSKKVKVQYKGELKYKVFGFSHIYVVDKTEEVKFKY